MIYSLEAADATSPVRSADVNAAVLPPATRGATEVAQVLRQPSLGLPPARVEFPTRPYDPNLALRHVGAAALTDMGVDQFGGFKISGIAEYPFSRASRLEFSGGLRRFGFDREVTTQFLSPRTGAILDEQTRDLETAPAINLGQASMALVYNNAALGPTSPLLGTRSRLELTPTIGDLRWTELLLDYRRYFSPVTPITIAGRALHFGRYGGGADDPRLPPLFVGYPNLVRGYDVDSFTLSECRLDARFECPVFDQLLGRRLAVANIEVRAPIPGLFTGEVDYWPLPLEVFAFGDTGVAWARGDEPAFLGGSRQLVSSVGAGVRANVFGYLVTEFNAVRPLDRDGLVRHRPAPRPWHPPCICSPSCRRLALARSSRRATHSARSWRGTRAVSRGHGAFTLRRGEA